MKKMKIKTIKNGVVIDHITAGRSMKVLNAIGHKKKTVIMVMNVKSSKIGKKDIIKIENRSLSAKEMKKVFSIAPRATINKIKRSRVIKKITK